MAIVVLLLLAERRADAYSVLSHEEVVDLAWLPQIVPLLKARYPGLTDDQLRMAHAYAYGGSIIQDIGYYPFGSHQFSDMVHYVRSGDFVSTMIRESNDPNEFAFALGALAHYCGDVEGHPTINLVTSQQNPKLRARFGQIVTYDENPVAHVRTEFGFDVVEVAHGRYSQENYRDFIGFQVSKPLMERAFMETYGVPVNLIMKNEDLAIGSYRWAVSSLIPKMTKVALVSYKGDIEKENPGFDHKKFVYRLKRTEFEQSYGTQYAKPGFGTRVLAFFIGILPKVGPLKSLQVKVPDAAQQDLYLKSINHTVDRYDHYLEAMTQQTASVTTVMTAPELKEIDLDTGHPAQFGEYQLADESYGGLLDLLLHDPKTQMKADVRQSFVDFYSKRSQPEWYAKKPKVWEKLQVDLKAFDATGAANAIAAAGAAESSATTAPTAVN
ncbi:hypothetical protein HDF16_003888 [Granulicella aggregans]|uniref:Phospholipase C/D domain-containing protein n=1 Tax=Granulicella aggregans TaxID=474949 RepID=A0A7W8E6D9_9BACT|nr:zinc dependent phospholipase C family protein [Granulicella aggregans]MBB5059165.1 hypothetical protein [Granulicella aggregans]